MGVRGGACLQGSRAALQRGARQQGRRVGRIAWVSGQRDGIGWKQASIQYTRQAGRIEYCAPFLFSFTDSVGTATLGSYC